MKATKLLRYYDHEFRKNGNRSDTGIQILENKLSVVISQ